MRTVTFRSVYEAILRRMGYDPLGDAVKQDVAQNVLEHINNRTRFIWPIADWPELNLVEWRAFRTVWTPTSIFSLGDELYYLGDGITVQPADTDFSADYPGPNEGYYQCIGPNPPQGTLPTNATYFVLYGQGTHPPSNVALADRYIAYAQTEQNVIGELLDVYPQNPRTVRAVSIMRQAPSSLGVDVHTGLNVVWIRYRIPVSQFTLTPVMPGQAGIFTHYNPVVGDCFISPAETLVPMPVFLSGYIRAAAYADAVLETTMEAKIRLTVSQAAMEEAMEYLQRELDILAVQGHREYYPAFPSRHRHRGIDIGAGAVPTENFAGFS